MLPGTIKLRRKAPLLYEKAKKLALTSDSFLIFLNAYCLAASEENAAGNIVVTAPTSGASGLFQA
jgi:L-serine dehydratase